MTWAPQRIASLVSGGLLKSTVCLAVFQLVMSADPLPVTLSPVWLSASNVGDFRIWSVSEAQGRQMTGKEKNLHKVWVFALLQLSHLPGFQGNWIIFPQMYPDAVFTLWISDRFVLHGRGLRDFTHMSNMCCCFTCFSCLLKRRRNLK